jgi:hypothetical protein
MSSSPAPTEEFSDLPAHRRTYESYTRFVLKGVVGTIILVLFIGWITGVL